MLVEALLAGVLQLSRNAQIDASSDAPPPTAYDLTEEQAQQRTYAWRRISLCPTEKVSGPRVVRVKDVLCVTGSLNDTMEALITDESLAGAEAVVITSGGGYWISAYRLGERLEAANTTLIAYKQCLSACTSILVPLATKKIIFDFTGFAFHGGIPPAEMAAGLHPGLSAEKLAEMQANLRLIRAGLARRGIDPDIGADVPDELNISAATGAWVMWTPKRAAYEKWGVKGILYYAPKGRPE
jgi:hypothetical protein